MSSFYDRTLRWRSAAGAAAGNGATAPRGIAGRAIRLLGAVLRRVRADHEARVGRRHLHSMSDWQLKDIGISRGEIEHCVRARPARSRRSRHAPD